MINLYQKQVDNLISEIRTLSAQITEQNMRLEALEGSVDLIVEGSPSAPNVWLKPSQLGKLVGLSGSSITKYRHQGIFNKLSIKSRQKGSRIDYYYHRQNALKDLQKIRPVTIKNNSIFVLDNA